MLHTQRPIELLAPAKDLPCGMEAVRHGADAVYIGAPKFGARAAAGNTAGDIKALCDYAHLFDVRVYAALNTILKEEELEEAERLIGLLYRAGVDALIVQDMGITGLRLPPIPLHASTQTDNRTPEKVKFLEAAGFDRVILARELSLEQIREIRVATSVPLEVFVHGSLCVSYSGQCYLSAAWSGRSANRGECAQCCRLPYSLTDAEGKVLIADKHLLSLKDMNRSGHLEALLEAGVSSLKIEGRLKDVSYVKNVTAYYRQKLDTLFTRRSEYCRSSAGHSTYTFDPAPEKSFNRGFTEYFLHGRTADITAFDTPKSVGEPVGTVKELKGNSFTVAGLKPLHNGDGLAFFNDCGELEGFRVNRAEANRIYPAEMPVLKPKTPLYRNYDHEFEKLLSKPSAERKLSVRITFGDNPFGFTLALTDETGARILITRPFAKEPAQREQEENIRTQLSKLGNTPFEASEVSISLTANYFIPSSLLTEMRRAGVEKLLSNRKTRFRPNQAKQQPDTPPPYPDKHLTYLSNVSNSLAASFYRSCGAVCVEPAFELSPRTDVPLMFTKHCLRYSLGCCPSRPQKEKPPYYKGDLYLLHKGNRLRLAFDCRRCECILQSE
ncbi:putative protease yhbU precursor [Bacteroidales bacterium Barb6XT]|nr:putative protease yhbU precursor [Bacteroidales bacterium Barb6XT]